MSDAIRKEIDQLRIRIEALGIPEPRKPYVPVALASVLVDRCSPLYEYVAKYTALCNDADAVLPANDGIFDRYSDYLKLIWNTELQINSFAVGMTIARQTIEKADEESDPGRYVRRLLQALQIAKLGYRVTLSTAAYDYKRSNSENYEQLKEIKREYDRLKADDAYLIAEINKYKEEL